MPEQTLTPMGAAFAAFLDAQDAVPAEGKYIPDDGICAACDRLRRDHPGVEMVLAIRRLKYFDPEKGRLIIKTGIPYCNCGQKRGAPERAPLTAERG